MKGVRLDTLLDAIDALHAKACDLDHERKVARRYAAMGATSEVDRGVSGTREPDITVAGRALRSDAYERACEEILAEMLSVVWSLLDLNPAVRADQRPRQTA